MREGGGRVVWEVGLESRLKRVYLCSLRRIALVGGGYQLHGMAFGLDGGSWLQGLCILLLLYTEIS